MGKRLDDLNLGDSGPSPRDELGIMRRRAAAFLEEVESLLGDGEHDFAYGYLSDLKLTLEKTERVTDAQVQAVENIKAGKVRHDEQMEGWRRHERRTGRRYEGWTPSD